MTPGGPGTGGPATREHGGPGGGPTILVVEDEELQPGSVDGGAFACEGFHVELAADGVDALRRFLERQPDLVVLDLLLPSMSGIEVCRRMRAIAPVPIIIVSALDTETDIVRGLELGAEDYIAEPYRLRELVARHPLGPPTSRPASAPGTRNCADRALTRRRHCRRPLPRELRSPRRHRGRGTDPPVASRVRPLGVAAVAARPGAHSRNSSSTNSGPAGTSPITWTLDTHVRRLRVKLGLDPGLCDLVTVRGVGISLRVLGERGWRAAWPYDLCVGFRRRRHRVDALPTTPLTTATVGFDVALPVVDAAPGGCGATDGGGGVIDTGRGGSADARGATGTGTGCFVGSGVTGAGTGGRGGSGVGSDTGVGRFGSDTGVGRFGGRGCQRLGCGRLR